MASGTVETMGVRDVMGDRAGWVKAMYRARLNLHTPSRISHAVEDTTRCGGRMGNRGNGTV